jgi:hypothetical protein
MGSAFFIFDSYLLFDDEAVGENLDVCDNLKTVGGDGLTGSPLAPAGQQPRLSYIGCQQTVGDHRPYS